MKKIFAFLYFFILSCFLFSVTAQAYIDPSAMTYIIQLVAGVAIAAGAAFGFYFRRIKRFFTRLFDKSGRATDNWKYDETDDDTTGMGDYPVLECDRWAPGELEEQNAPIACGISFDAIYAKYADKYDERGYDEYRANAEIKRLASLGADKQ